MVAGAVVVTSGVAVAGAVVVTSGVVVVVPVVVTSGVVVAGAGVDVAVSYCSRLGCLGPDTLLQCLAPVSRMVQVWEVWL